MISKEFFVQTMNRLDELDEKMGKVDEAFKEFSPGFCGFYIPEIIDMTVDILREVFDDQENDSLGYCVYELDFLHKYRTGCVTEEDGQPVDLSSWDKVYDFLIESMEE